MTTKTKPETQPAVPLYTREDLENAIKRQFAQEKGRISIRFVGSVKGSSLHRFRVNWWGEDSIINSRYLKVVADEEGIEITELED